MKTMTMVGGNIDKKILTKCLHKARKMINFTKFRCKHFSFIVRKNKIVSIGYNQQYKTHPIAAKYGHRFCSIHSEIHAISNYKYDLSECKIINIRLDQWGNMKCSRPCEFCEKLINDNMLKCIYSNEDGFYEFN